MSDQDRDPSPGDVPRPASIWDALLAEDQTEIDCEKLAAYAEGRLDPQEREEMRKTVARSSVAMELLDGLHETQEEARDRQASDDARSPAVSVWQNLLQRRAPALAMAASLLLAVGLSWLAWQRTRTAHNLRTQVASLDRTLQARHRDLALARKEQVALLSARRPLMAGEMSPGLVQLALAETVSLRGIPELTDAERREREDQLQRTLTALRDAVQLAPATGIARFVEEQATELAAGRADQVLRRVDDAMDEYGERPELLNLRAIALVQQSEDLPLTSAETLLVDAERLLEQLTQANSEYRPGWFNLAIVRETLARIADGAERQRKEREALQAWQEYLQRETRPEFRESVRASRNVAETR
jgi:hypothetical protein